MRFAVQVPGEVLLRLEVPITNSAVEKALRGLLEFVEVASALLVVVELLPTGHLNATESALDALCLLPATGFFPDGCCGAAAVPDSDDGRDSRNRGQYWVWVLGDSLLGDSLLGDSLLELGSH